MEPFSVTIDRSIKINGHGGRHFDPRKLEFCQNGLGVKCHTHTLIPSFKIWILWTIQKYMHPCMAQYFLLSWLKRYLKNRIIQAFCICLSTYGPCSHECGSMLIWFLLESDYLHKYWMKNYSNPLPVVIMAYK